METLSLSISIMYLIRMIINNVYYFYLKFLLVSPCSNTSFFVVIHNFFQQNLVTTIALRSVAAAVTASPSVGLSGNTSLRRPFINVVTLRQGWLVK